MGRKGRWDTSCRACMEGSCSDRGSVLGCRADSDFLCTPNCDRLRDMSRVHWCDSQPVEGSVGCKYTCCSIDGKKWGGDAEPQEMPRSAAWESCSFLDCRKKGNLREDVGSADLPG